MIHNKNLVGVLLARRKDTDVSSAYVKVLSCPMFRDYKNWVIWVGNCGG